MARAKELLKSKKAMSSYVFAMVVMLVILMLSSAVWEYTQTVTLARETADCSTSALRYVYTDSGFQRVAKLAVAYGRLDKVPVEKYKNIYIEEFMLQTGIEKISDGVYVKKQGDKIVYTISNIRLSSTAISNYAIKLAVDYDLALPLSLAGTVETTINVDMHREVSVSFAGTGGTGARS